MDDPIVVRGLATAAGCHLGMRRARSDMLAVPGMRTAVARPSPVALLSETPRTSGITVPRLLPLRPRDEARVSAHRATPLAWTVDVVAGKRTLVEKPPLAVGRQFVDGVHALTSGSSTMLSS